MAEGEHLMKLIEKVKHEVVKAGLIAPGDHVVAAVSGGPDSVALLHMLRQLAAPLQFSLSAAHVNHHFRGAEAAQEAEGVRELAEAWGIPCDIAHIDVPQYIASSGKNPQDAAREKRYEFLAEAARSRGAARIALAHHADDQAETVLM